jgi:hypothetical protein
MPLREWSLLLICECMDWTASFMAYRLNFLMTLIFYPCMDLSWFIKYSIVFCKGAALEASVEVGSSAPRFNRYIDSSRYQNLSRDKSDCGFTIIGAGFTSTSEKAWLLSDFKPGLWDTKFIAVWLAWRNTRFCGYDLSWLFALFARSKFFLTDASPSSSSP